MKANNTLTLPNGFDPNSTNPNSVHLRLIFQELTKTFSTRLLGSNLNGSNKVNNGLYGAMNEIIQNKNIVLSIYNLELDKINNGNDRGVDEDGFYDLLSNIKGEKENTRKLFIFSSALLPTDGLFTYYSLPNNFSEENKISSNVFGAYCIGIKNIGGAKFYTFLEFTKDGKSMIHTYTNGGGGDAGTIYRPSARTITFQDIETD